MKSTLFLIVGIAAFNIDAMMVDTPDWAFHALLRITGVVMLISSHAHFQTENK